MGKMQMTELVEQWSGVWSSKAPSIVRNVKWNRKEMREGRG